MSLNGRSFDEAGHDHLIHILAASDYSERYLRLCDGFAVECDVDTPALPLARVADMFRSVGTQVHLNKRFRVLTFEPQEAAGWTWHGKLVVQRYNNLEPMFEGDAPRHVVGSTMLDLALDASDRRPSPIPRTRFLPPHPNRPRFDGDLRTMEPLVRDLVALTRWMCELIAESWTVPPGAPP